MKKKVLKQLKAKEIIEQIAESKEKLRKLRFQFGIARSLENPRSIRNTKRSIAKLNTLINLGKKQEGKTV